MYVCMYECTTYEQEESLLFSSVHVYICCYISVHMTESTGMDKGFIDDGFSPFTGTVQFAGKTTRTRRTINSSDVFVFAC